MKTKRLLTTGHTVRCVLFIAFFAGGPVVMAQPSADDVISYTGGGSMGKKTIVPGLEKLAIAQATLIFKTGTTKEFFKNERGAFGGRKAGGGAIAMRSTGFLEFSDGEMGDADYQELTDYFYAALQEKLKGVGVQPVPWDQITQTDYYKSVEEETEGVAEAQKKGQLFVTYNANGGKSIAKYGPYNTMNGGFAFGKMKRVAAFSKDLDAPVLFVHAVVDFIDMLLEGDVKTSSSTRDYSLSQGYSIVTKSKSFSTNAQAFPNVKVAGVAEANDLAGRGEGGRFLFYNSKTQADYMGFAADVSSGVEFADRMDNDPDRKALKTADNIFAKDFNYEPVVIVTTKEKYKAAAKKALDNAASAFAEKIRLNRK